MPGVRRYVTQRELRRADKPCKACKKPIAGACVGLSYRGGRGQFLTDVFHEACARDAVRAPEDEVAWWDAGHLYDVRIASEPASCALGGVIAAGDLVFVCPCVDYGKSEPKTFAANAALATRDFDLENLEQRLAVAASQGVDLARAKDLPPEIATRIGSASRGATLYGVDRKGGKKDALEWLLFWKCAVPEAGKRRIAEQLGTGLSLAWELDRVLAVRLTDPRASKLTVRGFIDRVTGQREALEAVAPLLAGHLSGAGPVRESWAFARADAGLPAYRFPLLNHGIASGDLVVKFRERLANSTARDLLESYEESGWSCVLSKAQRLWVSRPGSFWEPGALLEELDAEAAIEWAVLGDPRGAGPDDPWAVWSRAHVVLEEVAREVDEARVEPVAGEEAIVRLLREAEELASADDATDDPGMLVSAMNTILARLPRGRPERRKVEKLYQALLAEIAREAL